MTLNEYRVTRSLTYHELAKELEIPYATIWNYCNPEKTERKKTSIKLDTAYLIMTKTGGMVSYKDLLKEEATV